MTDLAALSQLGEHTVEWRDGTLDIARRVQHGDELWRGDPQMQLRFNFLDQRFEVWGVDAEGNGYLAASHDRCDHTLLTKLAAGDWQRGKAAAAQVVLHERALEKERLRKDADKRGEVIDKLGWAIRRDLHGTRRTFGQVGGRG